MTSDGLAEIRCGAVVADSLANENPFADSFDAELWGCQFLLERKTKGACRGGEDSDLVCAAALDGTTETMDARGRLTLVVAGRQPRAFDAELG